MERIAIVRATNYLPYDGIIHSLSNTPNLIIDTSSEFRNKIKNLLIKKGILKTEGLSTGDIIKEIQRIIKDYLPYSSNYNSVVLFSLNGLVPDDIEAGFANNTFSNKDIVIIDDLEYHLNNSNVVSIVATDTAIYGDVHLSDKCIILIRKERYEKLTDIDKKRLKGKIKVFEGDLRQAVENALLEMGYHPERPLLGSGHDGFADSNTKQNTVDTIRKISISKNIPMQYHFNYALKNDTLKINAISNYYLITFYVYLKKYINFSNQLLENLVNDPESSYNLDILINEIENYGIDKYKELVRMFNQLLEELKKKGQLPTPEQIANQTSMLEINNIRK